MKKTFTTDSGDLIDWYRGIRRELPWRRDRDPYRIWISEVMLQQTTVVAVIPFYEKFLTRFPTLVTLARAPIGDVLEQWAGLGYYSRARNLHRAARVLAKTGFPKTALELIELPGFGPYTSRAVASLAFDEKTGVLDGNVIRILSRRFGLSVEWWKPKGRNELQEIADHLANVEAPADLNQGMMELGATVCTPHSPACLLCPWTKTCVARRDDRIAELPLRKPRRAMEMWKWKAQIVRKGERILLVPNDYAPFLKGHWILPGSVQRLDAAPKSFAFRGSVTHHDIFAQVTSRTAREVAARERKWVALSDLKREVPVSLIRKAIDAGLEKDS
ncbi:MAG: A/G-specific adenine glycosylase [Bdellovibrionota bacterium]